MKTVMIREFYDTLDQVRVYNVAKPQPKSDEILIKIINAGVNFVDTLYARGKHQNNRSLVTPPFTLGLEFSGTIVSAPAGCTFQPGDAIFGDGIGSYSEYLILPANSPSIQKLPSGWTFAEAAGLAATLPVSYGALAFWGKLVPGETVLIHAAAGGLGIMAVQVAVALGCTVIGTAGSPEKCAYARSYGAAQCFDYSHDSWWSLVLEATNGKGVDVVFDTVGLVSPSLKCAAPRARVLVVGFAGTEGSIEKIAMNRVLLKQIQLIGYRYGEGLRSHPQEREQIWRELRILLQSGKIKPTVYKCYDGLESAPKALADLASRKVLGKAVINVGHPDDDNQDEAKSRL